MLSDEDIELSIDYGSENSQSLPRNEVMASNNRMIIENDTIDNNFTLEKKRDFAYDTPGLHVSQKSQQSSNKNREIDIREWYNDYRIMHPYSCKLQIKDVKKGEGESNRFFSLQIMELPGSYYGCRCD